MSGVKVTRIATAGQELAGGYALDATYSGTDADVTTGLPLDGLLDVNAPAPADQDVLTWDDGAGEWIAQAGGGGPDVELVTVAATGATETIDVSVARTYDLTLTADCTFTLSGAVNGEAWFVTLLIRQDGTGGWDVTWPGSVEWATGSAPTIDPAMNALTVVTLGTVDGGTVWLGFPTGAPTLDGLSDVTAPTPADGDGIVWDAGASEWVNTHALTEDDVIALITPDIYACDSLTVISSKGSIAAGAHTDLHAVGGTTVQVNETATTPGFNIEAAFSGVDDITDVYVHGYYTASHTATVQLYNYDTTNWDTVLTFSASQSSMELLHASIADGAPYFDGSGNAVVRFYHADAGNPTHRLYLDYLAISHVAGSTGSLALDGLSDVDTTGKSDEDVLTWDLGTSTWIAAAAPSGSGIPATLLDAKGDLIVASAADTAARLAVGSNTYVLTADDGETLGLKWAAGGGGGAPTSSYYVTTATDGTLSNEVVIPGLAVPDRRLGGANDDEFDTTDTSDPITGWSTLGSFTTLDTNSTAASHLFQYNASIGYAVNGIYKAVPSIPFTVTAKLSGSLLGTDYVQAGILLGDATPTALYVFGPLFLSTYSGVQPFDIAAGKWTNRTTRSAASDTNTQNTLRNVWIRLIVNSSTDVDCQMSYDGFYWAEYYTAQNPGFTVSKVGLCLAGNTAGGACAAWWDYIRFT